MDRLRILLDDPDEAVRNMAYVLIRVAAIRPYKRKRLKYLVKVDRTLAKEFVNEVRQSNQCLSPICGSPPGS